MKQKVIITWGLPASGKSTWARKYISTHEGWVRISKDDIRTMLFNGKGANHVEIDRPLVTRIRDLAITTCLNTGKNIIVDGSHLDPDTIKAIKRLVKGKASVSMRYFLKTVGESVTNDILRDKEEQLGADAIRVYANKYLSEEPKV